MKDYPEIIAGKFASLEELISREAYEEAFRTTRTLTRIADSSEHCDGVLISEVMEGLYNQINDTFTSYEVTEDDRKNIQKLSLEHTRMLGKLFNTNDKLKIYDTLCGFRYAFTHIQLRYWDQGKTKVLRPPYVLR